MRDSSPFARGGREEGNQRLEDRVRRLENLRASEIPVDGLEPALDVQAALAERMVVVAAPATASSTGVAGQVAYDADYWYVCVGTDEWKRVGLATW